MHHATASVPAPAGLSFRALRPLLMLLVAVAALFVTGCNERELEYKQVEIDELNRLLAERDRQLAELRMSPPPVPTVAPTPEKTAVAVIDDPRVPITMKPKGTYITLESDVLFRPGSEILTPSAKSILNRVSVLLEKKYPGNKIIVEGHTDSDPINRTKNKWASNTELSRARAASVEKYLESRGVSRSLMTIEAKGESEPRDPKVKARNRRVEIIILK